MSASRMATRDTSGQIQALPQQVDAHQHIEFSQAQVADNLHALDGVAHRECMYRTPNTQVFHVNSVRSSAIFLVSVVTSTRSPTGRTGR